MARVAGRLPDHEPDARRSAALRFVLLVGVMSFFADFTYESSRAMVGPYFALLGASATVVAVVTGFGELLGYAFRLVSGGLSDRTGRFWTVTIVGYVIQMVSVPLLAVVPSWHLAAALVVLERLGRATRNPPRDVMLSHAGQALGYGWAFGVHEALDQLGALVGPLVAAAILSVHGDFRLTFALLAIPAGIMLAILVVARLVYPHPEGMEQATPTNVDPAGLPSTFWLYLGASLLVAAGFADFPLIAYHWARQSTVSDGAIPVFYAAAMGVSGLGSLLFGRLFDRHGLIVLLPLTLLSASFAPLAFLGGFWVALAGVAVWGLGAGVHESIIPAAVALIAPARRRASAYGLFTAGYGVFWFLGSVAIGLLYERSLDATVAFCVVTQLVAAPIFLLVHRRLATRRPKA